MLCTLSQSLSSGRWPPSQILRNILDVVREIAKLIGYSLTRQHLFLNKIREKVMVGTSEDERIGSLNQTAINTLCPTSWTVRTGAINAVMVNDNGRDH